MDSAIGFPNTYRWTVIYPVDSAIQRLNYHRAATQSVRVADRYFIVNVLVYRLPHRWWALNDHERLLNNSSAIHDIPIMNPSES